MASTELRAEDIRWNLADLCEGAEQARTEWTALVAQAQELASRYRGTIASLDAPALRELFDAADALEQGRRSHCPVVRRGRFETVA